MGSAASDAASGVDTSDAALLAAMVTQAASQDSFRQHGEAGKEAKSASRHGTGRHSSQSEQAPAMNGSTPPPSPPSTGFASSPFWPVQCGRTYVHSSAQPSIRRDPAFPSLPPSPPPGMGSDSETGAIAEGGSQSRRVGGTQKAKERGAIGWSKDERATESELNADSRRTGSGEGTSRECTARECTSRRTSVKACRMTTSDAKSRKGKNWKANLMSRHILERHGATIGFADPLAKLKMSPFVLTALKQSGALIATL